MGSDAKKAFNAEGRDELLLFDPDKLRIVDDEQSPLADVDRLAIPVPEWFIRSVMKRGVKVPITVRLNGKEDDGTPIVEVVYGRKRVRAAREANRRLRAEGGLPLRVPGTRTRGSDEEMFALMVLENEQRDDDTPLARAHKAKRALDMGYSVDEAAELMRVTPITIKNRLELLECSKEVQRAVELGQLPASTAATLAKLPREEQPAALEKMRAEGGLAGAAGRAAAERATSNGRHHPVDKDAEKPPSRPTLKRLLAELAADEEGRDAEDDLRAEGAIAVLRLVLDGKKPRGNVVARAFRAAQKEA